MEQQEAMTEESDQDSSGLANDCQYHFSINFLSRYAQLEEEAMVVEQEETNEENDFTHQPSQEEKIPRDRRRGVQMYDHVIIAN